MAEEVLVPFYIDDYESPNTNLIRGGTHKQKVAYCFMKTFALGSSEAIVARKTLENHKSNGYELINIDEVSTEKIEDLLTRSNKKLMVLFNQEKSTLTALEHIKEEHRPFYITRDISKQDLIAKEQAVLKSLDYTSLENKEQKEKLYKLLKRLQETKIEIAETERIIFQLEKTLSEKKLQVK